MSAHRLLTVMTAVWIAGTAATAQTYCRQALALGLDVSASVDATEYRLQLDGLAFALSDPDVTAAILSNTTATVRLAVYEWSDPGEERLILDWTDLNSQTALDAVRLRLTQTQRVDIGSSTGLGSALRTGFDLLARQDQCWTRTLDVSGDGKSNTGQRPQDVEAPADVIVNGLVVGVDDGNRGHERNLQIGELTAYYSSFVTRGPDSFVETALGYPDYADAMRRKLLRELTVQVIGRLQ